MQLNLTLIRHVSHIELSPLYKNVQLVHRRHKLKRTFRRRAARRVTTTGTCKPGKTKEKARGTGISKRKALVFLLPTGQPGVEVEEKNLSPAERRIRERCAIFERDIPLDDIRRIALLKSEIVARMAQLDPHLIRKY
ncbi:hypothetical protein U1Q18_050323 [Sarracenia purpurea var. burkii]